MGYTGGTTEDPTYADIGDHAEAIEIAYDPTEITYEQLILEFWSAHRPDAEPWSTQYRSAVFVHDEEQREVAERTKRMMARKLGRPVHTAVETAAVFTQAEDYHQKYRLRHQPDVFAELVAAYPMVDDLVRSTAAARLNAWVSGWGSQADRQRDLPRTGLSDTAQRSVARR